LHNDKCDAAGLLPRRLRFDDLLVDDRLSAPAATTEALVSRVPPSHAPATRSSMPVDFAIHGITIIIGTATISTSEVT